MEPNTSKSSLAIPIAIVVGFALIAVAIFFTGNRSSSTAPAITNNPSGNQNNPAPESLAQPVTQDDYIRGNPNAPIMLVEYSDYDCPFCKNFHDTMKLIMEEYGVDGKVGWVYRQFPLVQLHPNAPRISEAAFCVGELGGNNAFWTFSDLVFSEREINSPTNMTMLPGFAETAGVSRAEFNSCLESGRHRERVNESLQEGLAAGAQGTPHTVLMIGDQQAVINGAQPYAVVKQIIDNLITQLEGGAVTPDNTQIEVSS